MKKEIKVQIIQKKSYSKNKRENSCTFQIFALLLHRN